MKIAQVIKRPIISEKSTHAVGHSKFTFEVAITSSKYAVAEAVEALYKVNVINVTTSVVPGKTKRVPGTRRSYKATKWKKAVVELKAGQKIGLFDFGEKGEKKD